MRIAIDIDGTITAHPHFFAELTTAFFEHQIFIITGRSPHEREETEKLLNDHGIGYNSIHFIGPEKDAPYVMNWSLKGKFCLDNDIDILFEDMDDFISHIPARTLVFKVRNQHNFCFEKFAWFRQTEEKPNGL